MEGGRGNDPTATLGDTHDAAPCTEKKTLRILMMTDDVYLRACSSLAQFSQRHTVDVVRHPRFCNDQDQCGDMARLPWRRE